MSGQDIVKELTQGRKSRDRYREVMSWLRLLVATALGLVLVLLFLVMKKERPAYYATTTAGTVVPMNALSQPAINQVFLLRWAKIAVRSAYNFTFNNYADHFAAIKNNFTDSGLASFKTALSKSGFLAAVINKKLIVSAIVPDTPVVLFHGEIDGIYTWRIQMPLLITFQSASGSQNQSQYIVSLTVTRVPSLRAPLSGVQIQSFVTS